MTLRGLLVPVVLLSCAGCGDDGEPAAGSETSGAQTTGAATGEAASAADGSSGGAEGCAALEQTCVAAVGSVRTAITFDGVDHPAVAYGDDAGVQVRRWSGDAWQTLGDARPDRDLFGNGLGLFVVADALHLVSVDASAGIHIERYDGTAWADVDGSPWSIPGTSGVFAHATARDGVLWVVASGAGGIDPFHARRYDGAELTALTEADGAAPGLFAASPRIAAAAGGAVAVAYTIPAGLAIASNVAGTTQWTLGTQTTDGQYWDYGAFAWSADGGVVARARPDTHTLTAVRGDGTVWAPLGDPDGVIDTASDAGVIGDPAIVVDGAERPVVVYAFYAGATDVVTRARRWDGSAWTALPEGESTLAPGFAPATVSAAVSGNTLGVVSTRRDDASTSYLRFESFTLP
ncbi:MAG: hypothetical protein K1X88_05015 [Nannocystaceae bacterium]|nr:hypothetical protein [Nannocystaceae bacterium]